MTEHNYTMWIFIKMLKNKKTDHSINITIQC